MNNKEEDQSPVQAVLLITNDGYNPLLIDDYENFKEVFNVDGNCATPKDVDWHPMCGGFDTWCQSYSVVHARSGITYGEQSTPYLITHIYYMKC